MTLHQSAYADPELVDLFSDAPEFLAIADAVVASRGQISVSSVHRPRASRRRIGIGASLAFAAASAAALFLPMHSSTGGIANVALAAIGGGPVLHVVTESSAGSDLVDVATGQSSDLRLRTEVWFDQDKEQRREKSFIGASLINDTLKTPEGGYTPTGIIYDCAWIAAHPVAASDARVSCNADGSNGTSPRVEARPSPSIDPGLAGFLDGYRDALSSGRARADGSGTVNGEAVDWLKVETSSGAERVALDKRTHKPVFIAPADGPSFAVTVIESIAYDAATFARPPATELALQPSTTSADDVAQVQLNAAAISSAWPHAVWAGVSAAGLPLLQAALQQLTASYAHHAAPVERGVGLELEYGSTTGNGRLDRTKPYIDIQEAPSASLATMAGLVHGGFPQAGTVYLERGGSSGGGMTTAAADLGDTYAIIQASQVSQGDLLRVIRSLSRP